EVVIPSGVQAGAVFGGGRSGGGTDQFWQSDEIIGGHRQRELESQTLGSTQHGSGESADGLGPAERLLDQLALLLADRVAGMPRGAALDPRGSCGGIFGHVGPPV